MLKEPSSMRYPPSLNAHSPKQLRPAIAWIAIITFILLTLLCVVARLGMVLNLLFPAGALVVAALLYVRYPLMYVSFTWWLLVFGSLGKTAGRLLRGRMDRSEPNFCSRRC